MEEDLEEKNKKKAFIIDDEEGICILLSALLNKINFLSDYSLKLEGAVDKAVAFNANIIFLDLSLKDGSGFSILSDLKKRLENSKIIVISAHTENEESQRALKMGADIFLEKPLSTKAIKTAIEKLNW